MRIKKCSNKFCENINPQFYKNFKRCKYCVKVASLTQQLTPEGRYRVYRNNAAASGRSFKLTFEEFMTFWQKPCVVGCKIDTIGLDRIDNTKGYEIGNVRPMCAKHNVWKSNHSDIEIIEFAKALRK